MRLKTAVALLLRLKKALLEKSHRKKESMASGAACEALADPDSQQRKTGAKGVVTNLALSTDDLLEAKLKINQQQRFGKDIAALPSGSSTASKQSSICKLDSYLGNVLFLELEDE